jgi:hypothetical protein
MCSGSVKECRNVQDGFEAGKSRRPIQMPRCYQPTPPWYFRASVCPNVRLLASCRCDFRVSHEPLAELVFQSDYISWCRLSEWCSSKQIPASVSCTGYPLRFRTDVPNVALLATVLVGDVMSCGSYPCPSAMLCALPLPWIHALSNGKAPEIASL